MTGNTIFNRMDNPDGGLFPIKTQVALHPIAYHIICLFAPVAILLSTSCQTKQTEPLPPPGFIYVEDYHLMLNGKHYFPLILNYKVDLCDTAIRPASYYGEGTFDDHFDQIAGWGFNSLRICMDVANRVPDTTAFFLSVQHMLDCAAHHGLRVMLLIKPPFDSTWTNYTSALLRHFAHDTTVWAYDFMNEPLYFDPVEDRPKKDALRLATEWRAIKDRCAPHQLFTIALAEPIEVFEWDASLLPVDFVEIHTYHPLRVASEMYWYGHYVKRPWIVGETGLPADNDSVPYAWQTIFFRESFLCALSNGAAGYGWWEFHDCLKGTNFEAWHTGLRDAEGQAKPAASEICRLLELPHPAPAVQPKNYYNMLGYSNLSVSGRIIDKRTHHPIEGAVIRGWNEWWDVGMNTFSDEHGRFTLTSNDRCVHFEISAPGYDRIKFDTFPDYSPTPQSLPNQFLEYQQIDYRRFLANDSSLLTFYPTLFGKGTSYADIGTVKLPRM